MTTASGFTRVLATTLMKQVTHGRIWAVAALPL